MGDGMSISFLGFAESDKGAARWYSKDMGQSICFSENCDELESSGADTYVILADKIEAKQLNELKAREDKDSLHKYVFFTKTDIEAQYSQMMDERDAAIRTVSQTVSPDIFSEYQFVSFQMEGYIITGVEDSADSTEKYIWGYHKDSYKTLFVAMSMDGHDISSEIIAEKGKNSDIIRQKEYSDWMCMNMVDNMHFQSEYEKIRELPADLSNLSNLKTESDRVLDPYDIYYLGGSVHEGMTMDVSEVIELFTENGGISKDQFEKTRFLEVFNVNKIKGRLELQSKFADAIDIVFKNGGEVILNDMGQHIPGYETIHERIAGYDCRMVHINPYGYM